MSNNRVKSCRGDIRISSNPGHECVISRYHRGNGINRSGGARVHTTFRSNELAVQHQRWRLQRLAKLSRDYLSGLRGKRIRREVHQVHFRRRCGITDYDIIAADPPSGGVVCCDPTSFVKLATSPVDAGSCSSTSVTGSCASRVAFFSKSALSALVNQEVVATLSATWVAPSPSVTWLLTMKERPGRVNCFSAPAIAWRT